MAQNITPIFVLTGNMLPASIAAANTASDGSGSLVTLVTAGSNGTRIDAVRFRNAQASAAASSANVHRIFMSDAAGANPRLIGEVATAAATRSASVIGATSIYTFDYPIIMKTGQIMYITQHVYAGAQDLFHAIPYGGDY